MNRTVGLIVALLIIAVGSLAVFPIVMSMSQIGLAQSPVSSQIGQVRPPTAPFQAAPATQPAGECKCEACPAVSDKLTTVQAALNDLEKAIDSGDKAAAQAKLKTVRELIAKADISAHGFANTKCPIMGGAVDVKLAGDDVRMWKGMKVGFCCGGCPAAWDKLNDQEKQAKLDAAK